MSNLDIRHYYTRRRAIAFAMARSASNQNILFHPFRKRIDKHLVVVKMRQA